MSLDRLVVRNLTDTPTQPTSHMAGFKQVLLSDQETESKVTQIARNRIPAGCIVEEHVHPSMDEHFVFIEGKGKITVERKTIECVPELFVLIPAKTPHSVEAYSDLCFFTFSVAL